MPLGRRRPAPSRAALAVNRRMFLKAVALGMSVPAAMRLARMATAATTAPPKRFFLMYIPHGTAPEHFNPKVDGPGSAGAGELHRLRARPDQRQHPGRRCSRTSRTSTSTRGSSTRAPPTRTPASSTACRASTATDTTHGAHHRRARDREGAQRQAADPRRLLAHHERPGRERDAVLERDADRSREEPGQGVRQPVRRPDDRAAGQRRRAAAQGPARVHRVRGAGPADDAAEPDQRADTSWRRTWRRSSRCRRTRTR